MELSFVRSLITVLVFALFIGIAVWAYSSRRKQDFNEAANLPLQDDPPGSTGRDNDNNGAST